MYGLIFEYLGSMGRQETDAKAGVLLIRKVPER